MKIIDENSALRFREMIKEFVLKSHSKSVLDNQMPLSRWLKEKCSATDYEASNAEVLCDAFLHQECKLNEDESEPLEPIVTEEIGKGAAGDWDAEAFSRTDQEQNSLFNDTASVEEEGDGELFIRQMEDNQMG